MSRNSGKKRSTAGLILDVILTLCTGGSLADLDSDSVFEEQQLMNTTWIFAT